MNLPTKQKQTHSHREETMAAKGERYRGLGLADANYIEWLYISIQRMDKQQGPAVYHKQLYQYSLINNNGKEYKRKKYIKVHLYVYINITESLCYIADFNIIL